MRSSLQGAEFHVDHVIPRSCGGETTAENLALSCPGCNLRKSDRVAIQDDESGQLIALFNPRADVWEEHFAWAGYEIVGKSDVGRVTLKALQFNRPRRVRIRQVEELVGLFPP